MERIKLTHSEQEKMAAVIIRNLSVFMAKHGVFIYFGPMINPIARNVVDSVSDNGSG